MDRVATGVTGFDGLVQGGLPAGANILLTGRPGTGKTIFALQYLYNGALNGENGIYISLDSSFETLRVQARQLGMDIDGMEKQGKIFFLLIPIDRMRFDLFEMIKDVKKQINAKRVVFDNIQTFSININLFSIPLGYAGSAASTVSLTNIDSGKLGMGGSAARSGSSDTVHYTGNSEKRLIYMIIEELEKMGTTNILISYGGNTPSHTTIDGVSEFACDGIIQMYNELVGAKRSRTLSILKLRDTNHSQYIHDFEIGNGGITVKPAEQL